MAAMSGWRVEPLAALDKDYERYIFPRLRATLRDPSPSRVLLGLSFDHQPAGLAYCQHGTEPDTTWLTSLHVGAAYRRRGGGGLLLTEVERACWDAGRPGLRVRVAKNAPGTSELLALLQRHHWQPPALSMVNLICEAGPIHDSVSTWPAVTRWLASPGRYRFDPWTDLTAGDAVALGRLRQQPPFVPTMEPEQYLSRLDPACSLAVRRAGELVGWVLAVPFSGPLVATYGDRISRHYVSAYLDEALWSTAALIAGYCIAFGRQVEAYGPRSLAMYYSVMPRMQALTRRRFAPFALKFSEILEVRKTLA